MDSAGPAKNTRKAKRKKEVTHTEYWKKPIVSKGNPKETETVDKATKGKSKKKNENDTDGGGQGNGKSDDGSITKTNRTTKRKR